MNVAPQRRDFINRIIAVVHNSVSEKLLLDFSCWSITLQGKKVHGTTMTENKNNNKVRSTRARTDGRTDTHHQLTARRTQKQRQRGGRRRAECESRSVRRQRYGSRPEKKKERRFPCARRLREPARCARAFNRLARWSVGQMAEFLPPGAYDDDDDDDIIVRACARPRSLAHSLSLNGPFSATASWTAILARSSVS